MNWKYVKKLKSVELIKEYERLVNYELCDSFIQCVIRNNGGRPEKKIFDTDRVKERALKSFLSFNKEDRETVWKMYEWSKEELNDEFIPFAIDNFGNLICFDKHDDKIVFVNHEDNSVEIAAVNFDTFIESLHE
jgi:hypothetical protein